MIVNVNLGARSYDIIIQPGVTGQLAAQLNTYGLAPAKGLIITDTNVDAFHGNYLRECLLEAGKGYPVITIPAGEQSKSQECLFHIYEQALKAGLDRHAVVIALGGGVVGDLAGYAAASYMRGLRFVQVPTTLLAMVDSAVGGKTGINLPGGKNLIGAFHQPSLVLCDLQMLATLPPREFRAGMAEVIKYGVIADEALFHYCDVRMEQALAGDAATLEHLVARCCEIKADVVGQDETESGLRAILNFGHTLGHAIEAVAGYGTYLHGEAISVGMVFAARVSVRQTGLAPEAAEALEMLLKKTGLPVRAPALAWDELNRVMARDKKSAAGQPRFVLAQRLGQVDYGIPVEEALLREVWSGMV